MFANVTDELLDEILLSLELPPKISKREVADQLRQLCWAYLTWVQFFARQPTLHQGRDQMRRIADHADGLLSAVDKLPFEMRGALAMRFETDEDRIALRTLLDELQFLAGLAGRFSKEFKPSKKPTNRTLENYIGGLMLLFEKHLDRPVKIRVTKDGNNDPALISPAAKAITALLKAIDPKISTSSIVHRIATIRKSGDLKRYCFMLAKVTPR